MSELRNVVIVGGGLAGASAAFALRKEGFEGRVTILAEESELPYERPPMSKGYLRGEESIEKAYVRRAPEYEAQRIDLLNDTSATSIDLSDRRVQTTRGAIPFDALIMATGAEPRRLDVPGADLAGIHYLRNMTDADSLRVASATAQDIVVVGGGWIGSEVTASLRQLGRQVTFLTSGARPLEHVLGPRIADVYRAAHSDNGARLARGRLERLGGKDHVQWIETTDGRRFAADLVVVGIGAVPRAVLASAAGLRLHHGAIDADDRLGTSAPDVFAIGDVASAWNPRYGRSLRLEHWDNAKRQGRTVAATIVGRGAPYDRVPYLYSDQYDLGMEYRGLAPRWDEVVVRGDIDRREFHAFWLQGGRVAAAMNVNLWDDGDDLQAFVESGLQVNPHRLADADVPLADLAGRTVNA